MDSSSNYGTTNLGYESGRNINKEVLEMMDMINDLLI